MSQQKPILQKTAKSLLIVSVGVAGTTIGLWLFKVGSLGANVFMIYILLVVIMAVRVGRLAAVLTAIASLLSIDFFFVQPLYQFTIADPTEWLGLTVFLIVAVVTSELTARLRTEVENTRQHDAEMTALAETSWQVASENDSTSAIRKTFENMAKILALSSIAAILVHEDEPPKIRATFGMTADDTNKLLNENNLLAIELVRKQALPVGPYAPTFPNSFSMKMAATSAPATIDTNVTFVPIHIDGTVSAVIYIRSQKSEMATPRERTLLQALVNHVVLILQREKTFAAEAKAQALLEANKLKTALLSMVSHDFRSPLTSIKASIQTLKSAGSDLGSDDSVNLLDAVDEETERINKMVTNILDLSRLEAGAWRPKCESIPLEELVGSALSAFSQEANARITTKVDSTIPSLYADGVQIVQVLKNLLENALKYSPSSQLVEFVCRQEDDHLIMEVKDRGVGLSQDEREKVFEPFYRGKNLSESNIPGVGIGLSICKGLIEAHGGMITAANRDGGGSIFRVTLPLASEPVTAPVKAKIT
jgi:two-component system sensor histidine kinase KdpD